MLNGSRYKFLMHNVVTHKAIKICLAMILVPCVGSALSCTAKSNNKTPTAPAAHSTRGIKMQDIIQIQLDTKYKAILKNVSPITQMILHSNEIQPSQLRVIGPEGSEIQAFDRRSIQKFDNTVYAYSFVALSPRDVIPLFELIEKKGANDLKLIWGPYEYTLSAPGEYQLTVLWTSSIDTYINDVRKTETMRGVPQGTVSSNEITYKVK